MPQTLTLLLTDVVDSTRLNDQLGDAVMGPLWFEHDRRSRALMRQWRAREVARSDGFLLLFLRAADAVSFAHAYHTELGALDVPLRARIGIHTGPVSLRENNAEDIASGAPAVEIGGLALPMAARLMAAASGSQTLLSNDTLAALGADVRGDRVRVAIGAPHASSSAIPGSIHADAELRLCSHGHWRFKGIEARTQVFQLGDERSDFAPPPDSAKGYRVLLKGGEWVLARELPNNLPAERDQFVGRDADLSALAARLERGERLVSLLGIGGIGKTRLALRYARAWLGDHPGGAWFCDLSAAQGLDGIAYAVSQALDVPLGKANPVRLLGAAIAERGPCLLVLDNFEQVARHAEATLGVWLERAPLARFIVTSREVLGIVGEHAMALSPLLPAEAAQLLRERLTASGVGMSLSGDDEAAIEPLVELLDHLPLAIELAAARARVLPPATMLSRMDERFKLLAARGGRRDRQATLRATLDWSWELLSPAEKAALAQCSVFEGGFTLAAAEAVIDFAAIPDPPWTADVLQGLVEKSLLKRSGPRRFDLLRSVHDYAAEHLASSGRFPGSGEEQRRSAMERHWRYFANLNEQAAIADRCIETDNLVTACRRATSAGDLGAAADALVAAWAALNLIGPLNVAIEMADRLYRTAYPHAMPVAMTARWVSGHARYLAGEVTAARADLETAWWPGADARLRARTFCALGQLERSVGRFERANELLEQGLASAGEAGDSGLLCRAFNALGVLRLAQGQLDAAIAAFSTGLGAARAAADLKQQAALLGNIGVIEFERGNDDAALRHYQDALALAQRIGDRRFEGNMRSNLGFAHYQSNNLRAARVELDAALLIARSAGLARLFASVACNLALTSNTAGDTDAALRWFTEAIEVARRLEDQALEGQFRIYLGQFLASLGNDAGAQECLDQSRRLLAQSTDRTVLGLLECATIEAEIRDGDMAAARLRWVEWARRLEANGGVMTSELRRASARVGSLVNSR